MLILSILKKLSRATALAAIIFLGINGTARAATLTFDDIFTTDQQVIFNGYGGLNWNHFSVRNNLVASPRSGYNKGTVSGQYVAYNSFAKPATISVAKGQFDFNSVYLTAAWNNGLNILVEGFNGGVTKYSKTVTVNTVAPTLFNFDFQGIDRLKFTSSGGTYAGVGGRGEQIAIDNFTFNTTKSVPEPISVLGLLTFGALGATCALKRKR
ncbi:PEP-CTERM sorting domain-containing protein [Scytonema sp. NUACC26]|uniref:PEP-CTERM sorting domain-containing protein n=1 Tax=Scytonema sp. NUACC26 TaxID=3140176 RepID=UPI0034DBAEB0